tara:strand:- start:54 stop:611 length:558 start_codon:yes stop_codon:yes gene_type:complete
MINPDDFEDKDITEENEVIEEDENSDENSSENLTSSMLSLNNDLNSSTISINEEENFLLNNYKYSTDDQENIDITIENFIKLTNTYPELITMITSVQKNINLLPDLMKNIKLYNHKLALNLMDNPGFCFEKIFDILYNKSDDITEHTEAIDKIFDIFPYYSKDEIFEIYKECNYNVDLTIEKICY